MLTCDFYKDVPRATENVDEETLLQVVINKNSLKFMFFPSTILHLFVDVIRLERISLESKQKTVTQSLSEKNFCGIFP